MALKTFQAGRALAAIGVAAFHLSIMMGAPRYGGKEVFLEYTRLGNLRVGFFFLLSGFIILFAHVNDIGKPEKLPKFIFRRFVRLFPIYWLYTLFFVLALLLFGGTDASMPTTFADWITSLTLVRFTAAVQHLPDARKFFGNATETGAKNPPVRIDRGASKLLAGVGRCRRPGAGGLFDH